MVNPLPSQAVRMPKKIPIPIRAGPRVAMANNTNTPSVILRARGGLPCFPLACFPLGVSLGGDTLGGAGSLLGLACLAVAVKNSLSSISSPSKSASLDSSKSPETKWHHPDTQRWRCGLVHRYHTHNQSSPLAILQAIMNVQSTKPTVSRHLFHSIAKARI